MPEMVTHPHRQNYSNISNAVNRKYFDGILNRKIAISVECNKQERRNSQNLPSHEKGLQIAGKDDNVISHIEKKDGIEKPFVTIFTM